MYKYTLCFIRKGNQILMLNRLYPPNMGKWNGIGGNIRHDETPHQGAVREIFEETGIQVERAELAGTVTWITDKETSGMYVFIASVSSSFHYPTPVKAEEGILDWKDIEWILHPNNQGMASHIQQILPGMLSGERYEHRYSFSANGEIVDYRKMPITV